MDGKHLVGLPGKVAGAFQLSPPYNRIVVGWGWIRLEMRFKEILVDAEFRATQFEGGFEALCSAIERALVQTLVINSIDLNDCADGATLRDEAPVIDEAEYAALLGQCTGFPIVLEKFSDVKHG
jgi:hypothetical protein